MKRALTRCGTLSLATLALTAGVPSVAQAAPRAWHADLAGYSQPRTGVVTGSPITGRAQLVGPASGGSMLTATVAGMEPGHEYGVHVHFGTCADFLGHFKYDVAGPGTRPNEVWLDLVAGPSGNATDRVSVATLPTDGPLSIVVHAHANPDHTPTTPGVPQPGARLACGDFVPNGG